MKEVDDEKDTRNISQTKLMTLLLWQHMESLKYTSIFSCALFCNCFFNHLLFILLFCGGSLCGVCVSRQHFSLDHFKSCCEWIMLWCIYFTCFCQSENYLSKQWMAKGYEMCKSHHKLCEWGDSQKKCTQSNSALNRFKP